MRKWRKLIYRKLLNRLMPISKDQALQMLDIANKLNADIIHVYMGTEAVQLLPYLRIEKRLKIVSFHGIDTSGVVSDSDLIAIQMHVDLILVRCQSMKNILVKRGCDPERILLNTTGVPIPSASISPKSLEITESNPLRLVQSCRLIEKKGLDISIEVVKKIKDKIKYVQLDIYGSGPLRDTLLKEVRRSDLETNVVFHGFVENSILLKELTQFHFFIHPSRETEKSDREGIPNSILEAMAIGIPVVTTRHGGIPEAICHKTNGLLLDTSDASLLSQCILSAIHSNNDYVTMSLSAQATIRDKFSLRQNIEKLETAYARANFLKNIN